MKAIATVAAAAALLSLTACDRLGIGGGSANTNTAGNASGVSAGNSNTATSTAATGDKDPAAGAVPAASTGSATLDRNYIAGRWTDDGDCANAAEFTLDGRFFAANGNQGIWNLAGDRLTLQGSSTLTMQIVPIDQNTMTVVQADGSLGRSTRC